MHFLAVPNDVGSSLAQNVIANTRLFKYIENFTTKKERESFQIKILIFFIFLLKT